MTLFLERLTALSKKKSFWFSFHNVKFLVGWKFSVISFRR